MEDFTPSGGGWFFDEYDGPRFWANVNFAGGYDHENDPLATAQGQCWVWMGAYSGSKERPYGTFRITVGMRRAHRLAFRDFGNKLPEDLDIDHLCRNTRCVRPSHLEAVTALENVRRGINGNKTHCPSGHEYAGENIILRTRGGRTHRQCAICLKASQQRSYQRTIEFKRQRDAVA